MDEKFNTKYIINDIDLYIKSRQLADNHHN